MDIYYQNEILYVEIDGLLEEEDYKGFKRRIFKIINDYEINHVILHSSLSSFQIKRQLQQIQIEYYQKFDGLCFIN